MVSPLAHTFEWWSVDYFNSPVLNAEKPFAAWAENFTQKVKLRFAEGPRVLIGYSLGGRLALQALAKDPSLYDAVILLSANPGLTREKERFDRRQNDKAWAQKFSELPWQQVLSEWNAQPVFKDSVHEPIRSESDFERSQLASALTEWSLANQQDLREVIAKNSEKILWLSGDRDIKFQSIAMELKRLAPGLQTEIVPKASHRVIFDNPAETAAMMIRFLLAKG